MAESKKRNPARARIAHKLARYYRATPVHLTGANGLNTPSTSHLRNKSNNLELGGAPRRRLRNRNNTWYPADDEKKFFKRASKQAKPCQGRWNIQPGSVVILLSGKNRGRRVVVLKKLESGNLLITGPYAINGVALGRVNSAYVIPTSEIVSLAGVNSDEITDQFFKKARRFTKNELKNASEHRLKQAEEGKQQEQEWRN